MILKGIDTAQAIFSRLAPGSGDADGMPMLDAKRSTRRHPWLMQPTGTERQKLWRHVFSIATSRSRTREKAWEKGTPFVVDLSRCIRVYAAGHALAFISRILRCAP